MVRRMLEHSPFAGMDPYLERHWEAVHTMLIAYVCDAVQPQLPEELVARVEEKVAIHSDEQESYRHSDVFVMLETRGGSRSGGGVAGAVAEPIVLSVEEEPITERSIRIIDTEDNRVVTVIELLSPWNKLLGPDRETYLKKRREYLASDTNLVEIDLVRAGNWVNMMAPWHVPRRYRLHYRVTVKRVNSDCKLELYPISLREPLPTVRIPLRVERNEPDVILNLQALIEQVYRNGRYGRTDYSQPCEPPLAQPSHISPIPRIFRGRIAAGAAPARILCRNGL